MGRSRGWSPAPRRCDRRVLSRGTPPGTTPRRTRYVAGRLSTRVPEEAREGTDPGRCPAGIGRRGLAHEGPRQVRPRPPLPTVRQAGDRQAVAVHQRVRCVLSHDRLLPRAPSDRLQHLGSVAGSRRSTSTTRVSAKTSPETASSGSSSASATWVRPSSGAFSSASSRTARSDWRT